jgi:hypothetical protein
MTMFVFWVVMPRLVVGRYQRSALKNETVCFSETFISTCRTIMLQYIAKGCRFAQIL